MSSNLTSSDFSYTVDMKNSFIALIVLVVGIIVAGFVIPKISHVLTGEESEPVFCTMDAKMCPDGSYVGRTGPKCEFAACPGSGDSSGGILPYHSGIRGTVMLGPTCPVERIPPDPKCADKPYATRLAITSPDGARVVSEFSSDKEGRFEVSLPPGGYAIRSAVAANVLPYCSSQSPIIVEPDGYTEANVSCDSGIR